MTAIKRFFVIMICLCLLFAMPSFPAEAQGEAQRGGGPEGGEADPVRIMNLNLRYILNDWWTSEKDYVYASATSMKSDRQLTEERKLAIRQSAQTFADWREPGELSVLYLSREQAENGIRPIAHAIYCISLSLYFDYYDESVTGVSKEDAEAMCIKLISAVTGEHRANHPEAADDRYWGDSWQSPLWAENIGLGAWLLRERMEETALRKAQRPDIQGNRRHGHRPVLPAGRELLCFR